MEQRGSTLYLTLAVADRRHWSIEMTLTLRDVSNTYCTVLYCREKGEMHWAERIESGLPTEIGTSERKCSPQELDL
jgi:hypothetical protein